MVSLLRRLVIVGLLTLMAAPAWAQQVPLMSPADAHAKQRAGEIALVDVREPSEWTGTGVAEGAELIAMRDPQLGAKLDALTGGDRTSPVALICRSGVRSAAIAKAMADAGYTNVYSVDGGMVGTPAAPGWLKSYLPISKARRTAAGDVEICSTC